MTPSPPPSAASMSTGWAVIRASGVDFTNRDNPVPVTAEVLVVVAVVVPVVLAAVAAVAALAGSVRMVIKSEKPFEMVSARLVKSIVIQLPPLMVGLR